MPRRLLVALLLIALLPIGVAGWLGGRLAAEEQGRVEARFADLLQQRLGDYIAGIDQLLAARGRRVGNQLQGIARQPDPMTALRRAGLSHTFWQAADGRLLLPNRDGALSEGEQAFLQRTDAIWRDRVLLSSAVPAESGSDARNPEGASGWYGWHWGNGLNLLFWLRLPDGSVMGSEIDQLALLAEVIAFLPSDGEKGGRIRLLDARGRILYQWGSHEPAEGEAPRAQRPLNPPLEGWRLEYLTTAPAGGTGERLQLLSGLGALGVALLGLLLYLFRELTRAMREARERVSFVNQVSHELKTPLTNIRLYAELLAEDLEGDDETGRRIAVIVAETHRLSRLIGNVLSFARGQRGALRLHRQEIIPDQVVRDVVEQFRPALSDAGIAISLELRADRSVSLDPDAVAQILGNLIGNVEKYAAGGGALAVTSRVADGALAIGVSDRGPGIPKAHRRKLFRPFYRIRSDLTEGVSGTGIGLSIARELARLHGGDLVLVSAEGPGATFRLTIPLPEPG